MKPLTLPTLPPLPHLPVIYKKDVSVSVFARGMIGDDLLKDGPSLSEEFRAPA